LPRQCIVIGCGAHSASVISIIENSNVEYEILGLVDTADNFDGNEVKSGYKVISCLSDLLITPRKFAHLDCVVAVGDNKLRRLIYQKLTDLKFVLPNVVSRYAVVDHNVHMGQGNLIAHNAVVNSQTIIENNNLINTSVVVEHHCVIGSSNHLGPGAVLCGNANLANSIFLGAGSTVLPGVFIENHSTIGAGSVVAEDINIEHVTVLGVPARRKSK